MQGQTTQKLYIAINRNGTPLRKVLRVCALFIACIFLVVDVCFGQTDIRYSVPSMNIQTHLNPGEIAADMKVSSEVQVPLNRYGLLPETDFNDFTDENIVPDTERLESIPQVRPKGKRRTGTIIYRPSLLYLIGYNMVFIPIDTLFSVFNKKHKPFVHKSIPQIHSLWAMVFHLAIGVPFYFLAIWGASMLVDMFLGGFGKLLVTVLFTVYWSFYHVGFSSAVDGYTLTRNKKPIYISEKEHMLNKVVGVIMVTLFAATILGLAIAFLQFMPIIKTTFAGGLSVSNNLLNATQIMHHLAEYLGWSVGLFQRVCVILAAGGFWLWDAIMTISVIEKKGGKPYDLGTLLSFSFLFKTVAWLSFAIIGFYPASTLLKIIVIIVFASYFISDGLVAIGKVRTVLHIRKHMKELSQRDIVQKLEDMITGEIKGRGTSAYSALIVLESLARGRQSMDKVVQAFILGLELDSDVSPVATNLGRMRRSAIHVLVNNVGHVLRNVAYMPANKTDAISARYSSLIKSLRSELVMSGDAYRARREFVCEQLANLIVGSYEVMRGKGKEQADAIYCEAFEALLHAVEGNELSMDEKKLIVGRLNMLENDSRRFFLKLHRLDYILYDSIHEYIEQKPRNKGDVDIDEIAYVEPAQAPAISALVNRIEKVMPKAGADRQNWRTFNRLIGQLHEKQDVGVFVVKGPDMDNTSAFHNHELKKAEQYVFLDNFMKEEQKLNYFERRYVRTLIGNIRKHVANGMGVIVTERYEDYLKVTILDNGQGFSDEQGRQVSIGDVIQYGKSFGAHPGAGVGLSYAVGKLADVALVEQKNEAGITVTRDRNKPTDFSVAIEGNIIPIKKSHGTKITGYFYAGNGSLQDWQKEMAFKIQRNIKQRVRREQPETGDEEGVFFLAA